MTTITRRHALRLAGGSLGAAGLSAVALSSPSFLSSASAAAESLVAVLDKSTYAPKDRMVLRISTTGLSGYTTRVTDSRGTAWKAEQTTASSQVWSATAGAAGSGTVRVVLTLRSGRQVATQAAYKVVATGPLIGMSAPAGEWAQRISEVGPGVSARRIFADLSAGATNQIKLVEEAHAAKMLPVISYKVGGDIAGAVAGKYNAVAEQAAARLASYGLATAVTFWHEPNPDITGVQYAAASRQLLPIFRQGQLRVGPILNGWLLDNRQDVFASYCAEDLFGLWDWFGIDTYESGTTDNPGPTKPADRIPKLRDFLAARGHNLPLGIGEYNGYSAATIAAAGEMVLSTPNVWFASLWNSSGGKGIPLSGDRLTAYRTTLADPRARHLA